MGNFELQLSTETVCTTMAPKVVHSAGRSGEIRIWARGPPSWLARRSLAMYFIEGEKAFKV